MLAFKKIITAMTNKILVISLTKEKHLKDLAENLFIYASPRATIESGYEDQFHIGKNGKVTELCEKIEKIKKVKIDLIIVMTDIFTLSQFQPIDFPQEIDKIALVGDTHHGHKPITSLAQWLRMHQSNKIILKQTIHHADQFEKLGFQTASFPYYLHKQSLRKPIQPTNDRLVFCGSLGNTHKKRRYLIKEIGKYNRRMDIVMTRREVSFSIYNKWLYSLNIALNKDYNFRFNEIIGSGGCLITERLPIETRRKILYKEDEDYLAFDTTEEAIDKIEKTSLRDNIEMRISANKKLNEAINSKILIQIIFELHQRKVSNAEILYEEKLEEVIQYELAQERRLQKQ